MDSGARVGSWMQMWCCLLITQALEEQLLEDQHELEAGLVHSEASWADIVRPYLQNPHPRPQNQVES